MKKKLIVLAAILLSAGMLFAQEKTIDEAIADAGRAFGSTVPRQSKVLVLHFKSPTEKLGNYLIDKLTKALTGNPLFSVVEDRNRLPLGKYNLKIDAELSDDRAKTIGSELGMSVVITGAAVSSGNTCELTLRTVSVGTGRVLITLSYKLKADNILAELLKTNAPAAAQPTPAPAAQPAPAPAAKPAAPPIADGTYTFWPRPRATKGGVATNIYLVKVEFIEDYTVVYISTTSEGQGRAGGLVSSISDWERTVIRDLDKPQNVYNSTQVSWDDDNFKVLSFKRIASRHFRFSDDQQNPAAVFSNITLPENPD